MSSQASQIKSLIIGCVIIYALGYASATTSFYWLRDESPDQAYERGKIDGQLLDTMTPYVTMEILSPSESEIVSQVVDGDTLWFSRQKVDTGYVLNPVYRVRKLLRVPKDSIWYEDTVEVRCDE